MSAIEETAAPGREARVPTTANAISECRVWAEVMEGYADAARQDALRCDAEGKRDVADQFRTAAVDWQFRAQSLQRGADALEAIAPVEDKVRDLVRAYRAKGQPRAARRPAAEGAPA